MVPHDLELQQLGAALAQLAPRVHREVEEPLALLQLGGLLLDLADLELHPVDLLVGLVAAHLPLERRRLLEGREVVDLARELLRLALDLLGLLRLQWHQPLLSEEAELLGVLPLEGCLLELAYRLVSHQDVVLAQQAHYAAQRLEELVDLVVGLLHVLQVPHGRGELRHVVALHLGVEPAAHLAHEIVELRQAAEHRVLQVLRVREHPLGHPRRERLLGGPRVHLEPAARRRYGHQRHGVLQSLVVGDLLVEGVQRRLAPQPCARRVGGGGGGRLDLVGAGGGQGLGLVVVWAAGEELG
jgi:hypothetical protein